MAQINELRQLTFDDASWAAAQGHRRRAALDRLLARAVATERASLARALHDDLIQSLITAEMRVYATRQRLARRSKAAAAELLEVEKLLHQEVLSVRDLMQRVKPIRIEPEELFDYLANHVRKFAADTGIDARFSAKACQLSLSASMSAEVARLVQEALANVRKHSGARKVRVRLNHEAGRWSVVIEDDGRGLPVSWAVARRPSPTVIRDCVRSLNGELELRSATSGGLRLEISFPGEAPPAAPLQPTAGKKMARVLRSVARAHASDGSKR
jgi:two-component system, NarL family, sensor histidine kinase DegS